MEQHDERPRLVWHPAAWEDDPGWAVAAERRQRRSVGRGVDGRGVDQRGVDQRGVDQRGVPCRSVGERRVDQRSVRRRDVPPGCARVACVRATRRDTDAQAHRRCDAPHRAHSTTTASPGSASACTVRFIVRIVAGLSLWFSIIR